MPKFNRPGAVRIVARRVGGRAYQHLTQSLVSSEVRLSFMAWAYWLPCILVIMKSLLILSLVLLPATASFAQQAPPLTTTTAAAKLPVVLPPKKANTAFIQRRDSGLVALTALVQGLVNRGYAIKDVNREQLTVRTEPRAVSEVGGVVLDGAVRGRQFVLTGAFAPALTSHHSTPIVYPGEGRSGRASVAWEELVKTASLMGHRVTYRAE